jgi:capsular exopolysaccharide synthesis family protein
MLWRHKLLVAISMAAGLSIAQLVRLETVPRYEAESQVILDVRNTTILKFDSVLSGLPAQPEVTRTEMDVIGSRTMAERVLDHLSAADIRQLADDGAMTTPMSRFVRETWPGIVAHLIGWIPLLKHTAVLPSSAPSEIPEMGEGRTAAPEREELVNLILDGLKVSNDGRSYTIHIGFASPHPQFAARLANLYAEQYLANQLDLKTAAMKRANEWLSQRLVELLRELETSETALESYRRAAGILGDQGNTIVTQQIAEINMELAAAHNQRLDAQSRLRTAQAQLQNGGDLEALSDVLSSQVVQSLRAKQAELKRQDAQINSQYTAKYPGVKTVQTDITALQTQIANEVNRVIKSLADQVDIALNKEQSLGGDLARLKSQFGQGGEAEVKLKQLEREADANRVVYEAYLNRFKEITEQQQLQEADAQLVSRAPQPVVPTYPRYRPILALGLMIGTLVGISLAFLRDMLDPRLRSISQVEEMTGLPVLALMPSLPRRHLTRPEDYVLGRRDSLFNEALRTTWAAILLSRDPPVEPASVSVGNGRGRSRRRQPVSRGIAVLVTSSVPNEGKTAFCLSMARSLSVDGHKVLLIDADLRRPGVAKSFGRAKVGRMTELLEGKIELKDAVQIDERSGAHYLAAQIDDKHPQDILNSIWTGIVLDKARCTYDIILIDTPPILVAADAAIIAKFCDRCLFFVRWSATSRDCAAGALRRLTLYNVKVSGIVLSHVNLRRHAHYATGEGYYRPYGEIPKLLRIAHG